MFDDEQGYSLSEGPMIEEPATRANPPHENQFIAAQQKKACHTPIQGFLSNLSAKYSSSYLIDQSQTVCGIKPLCRLIEYNLVAVLYCT